MFPRMFVLTWLMYCGYYLCRKNLSVLIPYLKSEEGYTSTELAHVLFFYSLAYAAGQFITGALSDRFGARLVVTVGALISAASSSLMAVTGRLVFVQGSNGFAQSAGWPGVLKLAREWFPHEKRGIVMAWWGTHLVVGGFLGTILATNAAALGWRRGAWIPSICLTVITVLFALLSRDRPDNSEEEVLVSPGQLVISRPLLAISVMYFFVKLTRYAFLFWLPLYMTEALKYSKTDAGYFSSAYELIGFGGVLLAGYVSEQLRNVSRFAVAAVMMFALAIFCISYPYLSSSGPWFNFAAISMIGAFTFGPDTLMAGAGTQEAAPVQLTASAGGFVNGVGSIGQLISPYVVSGLSTWFGWHTLFACLGIAALLGGLALATQWKRG